jgi:hypothetical protein
MKLTRTLPILLTSLFAYSQANHLSANISGNVIDQSGNPVPGATVYLVQQGIAFDVPRQRAVKTDKNGLFDFRGGLDFGEYRVYSRKDSDGYPDYSDRFYAESNWESPTVDLTEEQASATVTVTMGNKAGVLIGQVVDARTRASVNAKLVFWDEEGNDHSVFVHGKFRALLPPQKNLTMMVLMSGYRTQSPADPLWLEPGQQIRLDILASR